MKKSATLLYRGKRSYAGGVIEIIVWQVPAPVPPSGHAFKYRLAFVQGGKGDHKHLGEIEMPYPFVDEAQLLADFWKDVKEATK